MECLKCKKLLVRTEDLISYDKLHLIHKPELEINPERLKVVRGSFLKHFFQI
jgi:hypothetical protein